jgi:23S rRNA pseudouridine1911/1915/1917 synthase
MKYTTKKTSSLLDTIMEIYHGVSKQKAKQIHGYSEFIIDGEKIAKHPKLIINAGSVIEVIQKSVNEKPLKLVPSHNRPVAIYFEDDYFIIALKPAGILSCSDQTLKNSKSFHKLLEAFILKRDERKQRLWPIHRLDKEVEGLIMFAKDEDTQEAMKESWQTVTKKYLALTENKPQDENGYIENWLKEGQEQKVFTFEKEVNGSKFAKTEFHYIRKERDYHLIELILHTGRKNQIRAHLAGIDCPIVGDRKYGADSSVKRQVRLAAYKLEFMHPITDESISMEYMPIARFFKPSKNEDENYKIV